MPPISPMSWAARRRRAKTRARPGAHALRLGAARRCFEPDLRHRHGEPLAAERFPSDAKLARGRPAPDRFDRAASPSGDARGPGAFVAAGTAGCVGFTAAPAGLNSASWAKVKFGVCL